MGFVLGLPVCKMPALAVLTYVFICTDWTFSVILTLTCGHRD